MMLSDVTLPAVMQHKLRRIRRRQLALTIARGFSVAAGVLFLVMLIAMSLDHWFMPTQVPVRTAITLTALLTAAGVLATGLRPLRGLRRLSNTAASVDASIPHLEQRWTTVADRAARGGQPTGLAAAPQGLDRAMLRLVTGEAVAMAQLVEPSRIATSAGLRRPLIVLCGTIAVLGLFLAADWPHRRILLQRFLMPSAPITATQLHCETGDVTVQRGRPLDLSFRLAGVPRDKAHLELVHDDGRIEFVALQRDESDALRLNHHVAALAGSFEYRGNAGDGRSRWYSVTAIDPPALAQTRIKLVAPDYVQRDVYEKPYLPQRLSAVEGSRLSLEFLPIQPPQRFELHLIDVEEAAVADDSSTDATRQVTLVPQPDGWYRYEIELTRDLSLRPWMISPHGLTGENDPTCFVRVIPDRPPTVKITQAGDETAAAPDQVIDVGFEAHDDHGIVRAELVVYRHSASADEPPIELAVQQIPLEDQRGAKYVRATVPLDLAQFDLPIGAEVSYAVRVADNRPARRDDAAEPGDEREHSADASPANEESPTRQSDLEGEAASARDTNRRSAADEAEREPRTATASGNESEPEPAAEVEADTADGNSRDGAPKDADASERESDARAGDDSQQSNRDLQNNDSNAESSGDSPAAARVAEEPADSLESSTDATAGEPADDAQPRDDHPTESADLAPLGPENESAENDDQDVTPRDAESTEPRDEQRSDELDRRDQADRAGQIGQDAESNRMQLRIVQRSSTGRSDDDASDESDQPPLRSRIEQIDAELEIAAGLLEELHHTAAANEFNETTAERIGDSDAQLVKVERLVADLRKDTDETPFAFVGLQMADIAGTHVTPARDRLFAVLSHGAVDAEPQLAEASHHVQRARELLAELLARYDRVVRERRTAEALEEAAQIYEVYVAGLQRMLRPQAAPSPNPLERSMAILTVDQEYLDRLQEVIEMRRDLMAEFGRMLADDPRLLSRFTDLLMRRQTSLRDQLTELHRRQQEISGELAGWRGVDESQREAVWMLVAELRLHDVGQLTRQAAELESRASSQLPLELNPDHRRPAAVLDRIGRLAVQARSLAAKSRRLLADPLDDSVDLVGDLRQMELLLSDLDVALAILEADHPGDDTESYVSNRRRESAALAEQIAVWTETAEQLQNQRYEGLAATDQQRLAVRTELFRLAMQNIDAELPGGFQGETPEGILKTVEELQASIEAVTFNQAAATFELLQDNSAAAEQQQASALSGFALAEELFDRLRRQIIEELDQEDPDNPNAADLDDPTLDAILARLEREPDLNALLGIPNRPNNVRQVAEWMQWNEEGRGDPDLNAAAERARRRAEEEQQMTAAESRDEDESDDGDWTEQQWQEIADADAAQEQMQQQIEQLRRLAADPDTDEEEADRLRRAAEQLEEMRRRLADEDLDEQQWRRLVRSEQMQAVLRAASLGEPLPDEQWNRIRSSLGDGLWQVRRRTPPEEYRRAIEQYQQRINRLRNMTQ